MCVYGHMLKKFRSVGNIFMPPAWKVRRGHLVFGSSVRPSVRPSVCPSVSLSVRNSVPLTFKVQYFKFGWSYSNQTWTESPSMDCSHFTDITCPWGWGRVQIWDLEILPYFDFVAGIDLGRAIAPLALIFRKWRREKTVWGPFGA